MRRFSAALAGAVLAIATLAPVAPASAQGAETFRQHATIPIDITVGNLCNPAEGPITLTGRWLVVARSTIDSQGGAHTSFQTTFQGLQGTTPTGVKYVATGTLSQQFNMQGQKGAASESTQVRTIRYTRIGNAPADDLDVYFLYHITQTPSGEITADIAVSRVSCE